VQLISSKTQGDGLTNKQGQQKIPSAFPIRSQTSTPISEATIAVVKIKEMYPDDKIMHSISIPLKSAVNFWHLSHSLGQRLMRQNSCYNTIGLPFECTICLKCGRVIMKVDDL
jgi:hypothetical protein